MHYQVSNALQDRSVGLGLDMHERAHAYLTAWQAATDVIRYKVGFFLGGSINIEMEA